jgi:hypothetical protein
MVVALLIFAMTSAPVAMDGGSGIEPKMRNAHLPPITTLTIQNSGATAPASGEPTKQCADFKLTHQEIRGYIGKAAEVAEHDYFHMLDWSPCYTSGKVTFKNGITGIWSIQQYRAGSLKLSNGRTLYLYCPQCQAKAFPTAE